MRITKKITSLSFIGFLFLFYLTGYSESSNLSSSIAQKAFEAIRTANKVYTFCASCGDSKAKVFYMNERGIEPVSDGKNGYEYRFYLNKKQYVNILDLYFQLENKWINLGLYSGLVNFSISYELKPSQLPFDIEVEAEKNFKIPSDLKPLTILEKQIFEEVNLVRTNPADYAKKLRERIPFFEDTVYRPLDRRPRQTRDGAKGIESAISFLEKISPMEPFVFSSDASLAIQEHLKNKIQYTSRWRELRERYGKYIKDAELINIMEGEFYGYNVAPDLITYILVSEGNAKGQFRNSIFDREQRYMGLGCQTDLRYGYKCHLLLTSGLVPEDNVRKMQLDRVTVSSISYLSEFEKKVIEETNLLRTKPKDYVEFLKARRPYYKDLLYKEPFRSPVVIVEGISALEEAIAFLEKVEPVSTLKPAEELSLSARDHVKDSGSKGITGHYGSDGSSPVTRIQRYRKDAKLAGENIDYGWVDPREVVISLFVDDGIYNRGHRKNLFQKDFVYIGVSCGFHLDYPLMCVQNFGAW